MGSQTRRPLARHGSRGLGTSPRRPPSSAGRLGPGRSRRNLRRRRASAPAGPRTAAGPRRRYGSTGSRTRWPSRRRAQAEPTGGRSCPAQGPGRTGRGRGRGTPQRRPGRQPGCQGIPQVRHQRPADVAPTGLQVRVHAGERAGHRALAPSPSGDAAVYHPARTPVPEADAMSSTRTERDSMGDMQVPADAHYGASTARAVENFPISGRGCPGRSWPPSGRSSGRRRRSTSS